MSKLVLTNEEQIEIEKAKEYLKAHGFVNPIMQTTNDCIIYNQRKDEYSSANGLLIAVYVNKGTEAKNRVIFKDFNRRARRIHIFPADYMLAPDLIGGCKLW